MCGILGYIGDLPPKENIIEANGLLSHRGPDSCGIYYDVNENVAFAHNRLSIIDLSEHANQPYKSNCERFILVYNGELYNYIELREELKEYYNFKSSSDTEVVLASYIVWKEKCLEKFNGMFAFAIYDKEAKKIFCARDRLGIKPFFWTLKDGALLFSSEIKGLLKLGVPKEVNVNSVVSYLKYNLLDHSEETFFDGIYSMPGGHYLEFKNGSKPEIYKYWSLMNGQLKKELANKSKKEIFRLFSELFNDSIRLRFRSDVPVGISLSSGLDSNSVYTLSKNISSDDLHLFTRKLKRVSNDESELLEVILTDEEKKRWHVPEYDPADLTALDRMIRIQDQPFSNILTSGYGKVFSFANKENVRVLLEGQGGDEILAGYLRYLNCYLMDIFQQHDYFSLYKFLFSKERFKLLKLFVLRRIKRIKFSILKKRNKKYINPAYFKSLSLEGKFDSPFEQELLNAQFQDLIYFKLPRALRFSDHASMAESCECRVPLLDHRLVEFCLNLSARYKIDLFNQKSLLRKFISSQGMNKKLIKRKKVGADASRYWFPKYYRNVFYDSLDSSFFKEFDILDLDLLRKDADIYFTHQGKPPLFIWQIISIAKWYDAYFGKET